MMPTASTLRTILFGSIGTLVETSDVQREAFNLAFRAFDIDLFWDADTYREKLASPGGRNRISAELEAIGQDTSGVLVDAIYEEKTSQFIKRLVAGVEARPGVLNLIEQANHAGVPIGFVSGTDRRVIDAVLEGGVGLSASQFDLILSGTDARNAKPDPELYLFALKQLRVEPMHCVAIEDTQASGMAAVQAGIPVIHTPGAMTVDQSFENAGACMDNLDGLGIGPLALDALRLWHGDQARQNGA